MKEIQLTYHKTYGQKFALIDDEDFELVSKYKWALQPSGKLFYARTYIGGKTIFLHRMLMNAQKGDVIDHLDHNGLNDRRDNLRFCTNAENNRYQQIRHHKNKSSQFKGVHWHKQKSKWMAQITYNWKHTYLGIFNTELEAAISYDKKAKELFGKFALLNFAVD